jgi:hypothetical protein
MSKLTRRARRLNLGPEDVVQNAKLGAGMIAAGSVPLVLFYLSGLADGKRLSFRSLLSEDFLEFHVLFFLLSFLGIVVMVAAGALGAHWWLERRMGRL